MGARTLISSTVLQLVSPPRAQFAKQTSCCIFRHTRASSNGRRLKKSRCLSFWVFLPSILSKVDVDWYLLSPDIALVDHKSGRSTKHPGRQVKVISLRR